MRNYRINNVTVERWAKLYSGPKFHALLCDPPYELGFMGKGWDKQGVAFHPDTWAGLAEHLHPGAFVMAFASSRGWHRLACAIEDAGLIIHPSIFGWAFGSGFPKATRVKADKIADFEGHRYGRQAMKPALEPIIVAQKPYAGRPVDSIVTTGAGSLWIDGGRIGNETITRTGFLDDMRGGQYGKGHVKHRTDLGIQIRTSTGRWPANFYLSHHPDCNGVCHPDCPVKKLGEQSGERTSGAGDKHSKTQDGNIFHGLMPISNIKEYDSDTGTAARFFFNADWSHEVSERISNADPVFYQGKATRDERDLGLDGIEKKQRDLSRNVKQVSMNDGEGNPYNRGVAEVHNSHPTVKPIALAEWLAKLLLPPSEYGPRRLLVPFAGSGSEIIGAYRAGWEFIEGVEMSREYTKIARARVNRWQSKGVQMSLFDEVA